MDKSRDRDLEQETILIIDEASKQEYTLGPGDRLLIGRYEPSSKGLRPAASSEALAARTFQYRSRSPDVSENHAEVRVAKDGRVWIKDLGSTNGTQVRAQPYQDIELHPNTEVRLGLSLLLQRRTPLWESIDDHGR